jgi:hypothetical protein
MKSRELHPIPHSDTPKSKATRRFRSGRGIGEVAWITYPLRWSDPIILGEQIRPGGWLNCPNVTPGGKFIFVLTPRNYEWNVSWLDAAVLEKHRPSGK